MFTNLVLGLSLLISAFALPDVSNMPLFAERDLICPNGSELHVQAFDPDPAKDELIIVYSRAGQVIAVNDGRNNTIAVVAERKVYTLEEAGAKFGSACNLPNPGVGI